MNSAKTPWHIWVVGVLSLIWHAGGAFDYVMSQTRNPKYLEMIPPEQLAFLDSFPTWVTALWAISIWSAVLGSLLLLLRRKLATPVFVISFLGMIGTSVHNIILADPGALDLMNGGQLAFTVAIFVIGILLIIYSGIQAGMGRLR